MAAPITTPAAVLKAFPTAATLSVCDGRRPLGIILDCRSKAPRSAPAPSFAWDAEGRFVGQFRTRQVAVVALGARDEHEAEQSRSRQNHGGE